ncbi:MAG: class I SAM-dependent methyltransferase [Candidatus Schekmanbacteria bacterium]|nr:class I SAM-dependent methyltransferase [Candidatus Schekmanbacteria bacterium]
MKKKLEANDLSRIETPRSKTDHGESTKSQIIHWASFYDVVFGWLLRRTHDEVVRLATSSPGERVLDVGCGTGSLAIALKASVGQTGLVHGIDASPEMIEVSRRNASRASADVNFTVGLGEAIPFPNETFDLVVSQLAIHHLPDDLKQSAIKEMHRVLKPNGRCMIVDFEPPKSITGRFATRMFLRPMIKINVKNYLPLMEEAGFTNIETGETRHRLLSFIRGQVAGC